MHAHRRQWKKKGADDLFEFLLFQYCIGHACIVYVVEPWNPQGYDHKVTTTREQSWIWDVVKDVFLKFKP